MLKTVLETLDGVDDAVKSFYAETDGKFILQIDGVDAHPEVAHLKSAYDTVKKDRNEIRIERDEAKDLAKNFPADFDLKKWEKIKDGKADEAQLVALRQELEGKITALTGELDAERGKSLKTAVDRDLSDALNAAGVNNPSFVKAARAIIAPTVKMEDGKPVIDSDMGPLGLTEFVKRWAAGEGKDFVTPPSGGGAKGGSGNGGPVTAEQFAKMGDKERTTLFNTDPETFRKLSGKP